MYVTVGVLLASLPSCCDPFGRCGCCSGAYGVAGAGCQCCTAAGQCRCCPGTYWTGAACVACLPGYYCSNGFGLTACPSGTYNALPGAYNASFCVPWSGTACAAGQYVQAPPSATADVACAACKTRCPAGQYMSGSCGGAGTSDTVACVACQACGAGLYRSPPCDGTRAADSLCAVCTSGGCPAGQYRGACGAEADGACVGCTACAAGWFNRGCAGNADGACARCSACGAGQVVFRACGGIADTGCKGAPCNASAPCGPLFCAYTVAATPNCSLVWQDHSGGASFLCQTSFTQGTCQQCPPGYSASGAYCLQCPNGQSCDATGAVACRGQCDVRNYPVCDASTGYATCLPCPGLNATALAAAQVVLTRGGVLGAPALCAAYFQCAKGYYLQSTQNNTALACGRCAVPEASASGWAFWSHGLTFGDAFSCLYAPAVAPTAANALGYYGALRTSCPPGGYTSAPGMAATAADCVACPIPPANGQFVEGVFDCSVQCALGYAPRGERCVPLNAHLIPCAGLAGFAVSPDGCEASPLPWNAPGFQALPGWGASVAANARAPMAAMDLASGLGATATALLDAAGGELCGAVVAVGPNVGYLQDKPLFAAVCSDIESHQFYLVVRGATFLYAFLERSFGFNNRFVLWQVDLRRGASGQYGKVWQAWRLPGKVCSAAWGQLQGVDHLYLALCDAPFLVFVRAYDLLALNYPYPADVSLAQRSGGLTAFAIGRRYGLLIGADEEGLADGMRDVARFSTTLSVANSSDPRRLFVADAENCRLVEVVIDTPGSFLTRAASIGPPSCFSGPAPLASPRLITSALGGAWAVFVTDAGVMQLDALTRSVLPVLPAAEWPLSPQWLGVADGGRTLLMANATHTAAVTRLQAPCPAHQTAASGGPCLECPQASYARPDGCAACSQPACAANQSLVACGGSQDAACRACTGSAPYPFVYAGNCSVVPVAPCPAGYYGLTTCSRCPEWFGPAAYASVPQHGICACFPYGGMVGGTCVVPSPFSAAPGPYPVPAWAAALGCTYAECPLRGCYLAQAFPRVCAPCAPGLHGRNGLWCEACPGFRAPTPAGDACICLPPAEMGPDGACVCPPGHSAGGAEGCAPCAAGTYRAAGSALPDDYAARPAAPCLACPPGTQTAPGGGSCAACPPGAYREAGMAACAACAGAGEYPADPADGGSCAACPAACGPGERWLPCPVDAARFVCEPCPALAGAAQRYVAGADNRACWTECLDGFYQDGSECRACTVAPCDPGFIFSPCTRYADHDCSLPCVNASKPAQNSVWAGGCSWACADGYVPRQRAMPGWTEYACEASGSAPWAGWW